MLWDAFSFDLWIYDMYMEDSVLPHYYKNSKSEFEEESWRQWTVKEGSRRIHDRMNRDGGKISTDDILSIWENFAQEIYDYACQNAKTRRMYLIIESTIRNMQNLFECLGGLA